MRLTATKRNPSLSVVLGHLLHRFAKLILIAIPVIASIRPGFSEEQSDSSRVPNIVLILADDMGWSDAACYGGEIRTPHIDSLSADGLRFTQFYNNAICGPTRASLLTGLYCQQTGHSGSHWNQPKDHSKCVLVSELLQAAGYRTMMVGKWQGRERPKERGFDRFFGPMCQAKISYYHEVQSNPFYLDDQRWEFPKEGFYMTEAFNDYAVQFLEEAVEREEPFFLYVAHIAPHWPLHAREEEIAPYREEYLRAGWDEHREARFTRQKEMGLVPQAWRLSPPSASVRPWKNDPQKAWQAERMAVYAAQISCLDRGVGRLLEVLRKSGAEENTLVMFLSDNGAAPDGGVVPSTSGFGFSPGGENAKWRLDGVPIRPGSGPDVMPGPHDTFAGYGLAWCNVSNSPLSGTKLTAFEGGIRTPLVVRWPGNVPKENSLSGEIGHVIDLLPTCLEAAGVEYPAEFRGRHPLPLEGKSLVPTFRGKQRIGHDVLCWSARTQAIRAGDWKLVNAGPGKPWELYNLAEDGTETNNLAAEQPERIQKLAELFAAWEKRVNVSP